MINTSNPNARDVTWITFRTKEKEFNIPVFSMTREQAIKVYETILSQPEVTFACAFVVGGGRL